MEQNRSADWRQQTREQRFAAVEIRRLASEVRARSRQLPAKSRKLYVSWCTVWTQSLKVRLAIHESDRRLPRESCMQLNDPVHNKRVPAVGSDSPAAPGECFTAPLSRTGIAFLKRSLVRNQLRRKVYRAGELRCISMARNVGNLTPG
jgi:hypothetical protein